jgi:hypothetical protein
MDICQIIFLFSDLITKEALILLHTNDRRLFKMEVAPNNRNALASLTEDVVLEILRRLPARSLLCYKCVCCSWNRLISDNRKVLRQIVASFFYDDEKDEQNFTSVTGERPTCPSFPTPLTK